MKAAGFVKLLSIAVNVFVAWAFWKAGADPAKAAAIASYWLIPTIIIVVELALIFHLYSSASFVQRLVDGRPEEIEAAGGPEQWKSVIERINRETNAELRSKGMEPYSWTFNFLTNGLHPLQKLVWITEVALGMAFVYIGWFWAGLACLVCTAVHFRTFVYLRSRAPRIVELAKM
jgi:hypothetical protein